MLSAIEHLQLCALLGDTQQALPQAARLPAKLLPHAGIKGKRGGQSNFLHAATDLKTTILYRSLFHPLVQGEGEVKILSRVLQPWAEVTPQDEHVIVAGDSDMVLMTLMMPNPNVYVLSEPARWAQSVSFLHTAWTATPSVRSLHIHKHKVLSLPMWVGTWQAFHMAGERHMVGTVSPSITLHVHACARPPRSPVKGKAVRLVRTNRPMFRGYTCFSPPALHQLWYRQHPFLRGSTPEVSIY